MSFDDYSTTPASNTSIQGINVGEGCAPAGINDAIRQLMADGKLLSDGLPVIGTDIQAYSAILQSLSADLTATAAELNTLDGITATVTELNYTDGVTSNIQTQLDAKIASGQSPSPASTGDFDNLTTGGKYTISGTWLNSPPDAGSAAQYGTAEVIERAFSSGLVVKQIVHTAGSTPSTYVRSGIGSPIVWGDWELVLTSGGKYESAEISVPASGSAITALNHGLGAKPFLVTAEIVCKTAEHGYAVGDTVVLANTGNATNTSDYGLGVAYNATQIKATVAQAGIAVVRLSDGDYQTITTSSWRLVFKAWAA